MGLGMKLGIMEGHDSLTLPASAVTAWPLAHATRGRELAFFFFSPSTKDGTQGLFHARQSTVPHDLCPQPILF
jgi:hypothetical protein